MLKALALKFALALTCFQGLSLATSGCNASGRIDTHFHVLPPAYIAAVNAAGGDPSGFSTPSWSPEAAIASMDKFGTASSILSVSTPGVPIAGTGQAARRLARELNQNLGNYTMRASYQGRFGFFGVLPDWRDINGTLAEIEYLYMRQKLCAGVTIYTAYGDMLPGNASFRPIWAALQRHKALVFLHPGVLDVVPKFLGNDFPQPILEYPLATTRAAVDLVISRTFRDHPDIDIILSHAGGTLPFLANRVLSGFLAPLARNTSRVTAEEAAEDFQRFYLDTALSSSAAQLDGMLDFTSPQKIVYGSDFPYLVGSGIQANIDSYDTFVRTNPRGSLIDPSVLRLNAIRLLAEHSQNPGLRETKDEGSGIDN
ncbi:putative Amidohydrolase-related domain-containing protein [Seiridium cardinale]